ncbi:hypothetical protein FRB98_001881 [Tulasnella sp. 332]|nr:hypothetical protein FRB98_001881 [Tulasnella sp. 332]
MRYSLLPSAPDLPPPATANNTNKQHPSHSSHSFFRFSSTRVSSRRSVIVVVCSLFLLYCYSTGRISYFRDVAVVVQRIEDSCADQLPTLVQPGELIRFNGEDGRTLDNYYVPLRSTFASPSAGASTAKGGDSALYPCIDDHIALGHTCVSHRGRGVHANLPQQLDVVWAYVNATDPIHVDNYQDHVDYLRSNNLKAYIPPGKKNAMREFDELRYSVRSVMTHFQKTARKLWIVTSDFPFPGCDGSSGWRVGQVPKWLTQREMNLNETWNDGKTELQLLHHSDIFEPMANRSTFNSLAIESRLGFIKGVADNFVYMNDDVFFNSELSPRDFYTEEYGPVFRMQSDVMIGHSIGPTSNLRGEWIALVYTNTLLGDRFGARSRPYLTHVAKALSIPILIELQTIWSNPLARTASHAFRSYVKTDPDVSTTLLQTHYVVERWREALLWSWVVGRIGADEDGEEGWDFSRAWRELGGELGKETLLVQRGARDTVGDVAAFQDNDTSMAKGKTDYVFSSFDGYPYTNLGSKGYRSFPEFTDKSASRARIAHPAFTCTLNSMTCFNVPQGQGLHSTPFITKASDMFKHVAFRHPDCGDCIISALITQSGRSGMDAFLPDKSRMFLQQGGGDQIDASSDAAAPRLPLTSLWNETDFSLRVVLPSSGSSGPINVREWAVRAIHRYRFVLGGTPVSFAQLETKRNAERTFKKLNTEQARPNPPGIICVNDDVVQGADDVRKMFREWMQSKWPKAPAWESW